MRNIELKATLPDRAAALRACAALAARPQGDIRQIDTYFHVPSGRLKLREAAPGRCELVYYHRADRPGPKGCDYSLEPVAASIKAILAEALGVLVVVEKVRTLFLWENVRIHIDSVMGLGDFIEFEAVLDADHDDADGVRKLEQLIAAFGIADPDHLSVSYLDLALAKVSPPAGGPTPA
jgi:adenylate cyclase class IV